MTDNDVESLVDEAMGDAEWPLEKVDQIDMTPADPAEKPKFLPTDLAEFHERKFLWAANYFVLWPLGMALTITYDVKAMEPEKFCGSEKTHDPHKFLVELAASDCMGTRREVRDLHVREWVLPEGLGETIEQEDKADVADYEEFLVNARARILNMTVEERKSALARLDNRNIASALNLLVAA